MVTMSVVAGNWRLGRINYLGINFVFICWLDNCGMNPGCVKFKNDKTKQTMDICYVSRMGVGRFFGDRSHTACWAADLR